MAAQGKSIDASNPTARLGRGKALALTYSPSGDRALHSIADELRRIGDALSRTANHVTALPAATPDLAAAAPAGDADAAEAPLAPEDEALFQALREWRAGEARKLGMPPYIVATDKALLGIVQRRPTRVEDLRDVPGFGPAKTAKYGPGVVEVVAAA